MQPTRTPPAATTRRAGVRIIGPGEVSQAASRNDAADESAPLENDPDADRVGMSLIAFLMVCALLGASVQLFLLGLGANEPLQAGTAFPA
jgi:hypothetical protein